jgi:hypothetical protein
MLARDRASEARFIVRSRYIRAKRDLLLARDTSRASEERLLARDTVSETRFIARSRYMRAKRDLLLARDICERGEIAR